MPLNNGGASKEIVIIPTCNNTKQLIKILADFNHVNVVDEICIVIDRASKQELQKIQVVSSKIQTLFNKFQKKGIGNAIRSG